MLQSQTELFDTTKEADTLEDLDKILKDSESIIVTLNSMKSSDRELDAQKDQFSWKISYLDDVRIAFEFDFDDPQVISTEGEDFLLMTFYNTDLYLVPQDPSKEALPDGYELQIVLPP